MGNVAKHLSRQGIYLFLLFHDILKFLTDPAMRYPCRKYNDKDATQIQKYYSCQDPFIHCVIYHSKNHQNFRNHQDQISEQQANQTAFRHSLPFIFHLSLALSLDLPQFNPFFTIYTNYKIKCNIFQPKIQGIFLDEVFFLPYNIVS